MTDDQQFTPPSKPVKWLVTHVGTQVQRTVYAQTAFVAANLAGWALSECTTEQVKE